MRRVEAGRPFRSAYREVAAALKKGESFDPPRPGEIIARRELDRRPGQSGPAGAEDADPAGAHLGRARAEALRPRPAQAGRQCGRPPARPPVRPALMTADRRKRHLKILELISTRAVRTQEELAEALTARAGR